MEIALVAENVLRIKTKQSTLVIDPSTLLRVKTAADAVIGFAAEGLSLAKIEGHRVVIREAGEYEIGGMKISGIRIDKNLVFELRADGLTMLLAKAANIEAIKDKADHCHILVLYADKICDASGITALEPDAVVVYGEKAADVAKALGKEGKTVEKYTVAADKLPAEMEVVVLT